MFSHSSTYLIKAKIAIHCNDIAIVETIIYQNS